MTDSEERAKVAAKLRAAADALDLDGMHLVRLLDAKLTLLAALNDIDRARSYGNPGAGLDELLSKKEDET